MEYKYSYPLIYTHSDVVLYYGWFPNLLNHLVWGGSFENLCENAKRELHVLLEVCIENNRIVPKPSDYNGIEDMRKSKLIPQDSICELIEVKVSKKLKFIDDEEEVI